MEDFFLYRLVLGVFDFYSNRYADVTINLNLIQQASFNTSYIRSRGNVLIRFVISVYGLKSCGL